MRARGRRAALGLAGGARRGRAGGDRAPRVAARAQGLPRGLTTRRCGRHSTTACRTPAATRPRWWRSSPATWGPTSPRTRAGAFFGFVIGGLHPASWGAELLVSTWDQERRPLPARPLGWRSPRSWRWEWLVDLLGLPTGTSVGFVTGGQMANFTCLAAARDQVLRDVGWDVEADGLPGAPPVTVVLKEGVHSTVPRALRFLGLGERSAVRVACDDDDRVRPDALAEVLSSVTGPTVLTVEARQREHRRLRPLRRRSPTSSTPTARPATRPGRTSTARSCCSPPRRRRWRRTSAGSTASTRGRPTRTSCSTSRTTAGSPSPATRPRTGPR